LLLQGCRRVPDVNYAKLVFSRALSSTSELRRYAKALGTLKVPLLKSFVGTHPSPFYRAKLNQGFYRLSCLYSYTRPGDGRIVGLTPDGKEVVALPLSARNKYRETIFEVPSPTTLTLHYSAEHPDCTIKLFAIGINSCHPNIQPPAEIRENSICAAVASYPDRELLLRDTVNSLIPQVDDLFIYLNNYRAVPNYLVSCPFAPKLHYILDTDSTRRAAAKFFWLAKHRCYWLICDDDIIYPPDYAAVMREKFRAHGERRVVGAHGTIFSPQFQHYYSSRTRDLLFAQALERDVRVHMLGTGTLFLHSSMLTAEDVALLQGRATENDETLAVICKRRGLAQISVARPAGWIKSHPQMKWGIYEENMMSLDKQLRLTELLAAENPWPDL
jgi:hypothetical protein